MMLLEMSNSNFSVFHLLINLLVQVLLGIPLEMVHKWWRVLVVYLAGVLAGSLGTSVVDPTVKLAGASGGVYSLVTAHIASIIMVRKGVLRSAKSTNFLIKYFMTQDIVNIQLADAVS